MVDRPAVTLNEQPVSRAASKLANDRNWVHAAIIA
jgi:hypothetical protein